MNAQLVRTYLWSMTSARRWTLVATGVALLLVAPFLAGRIPAGHSRVSAATLLARVQASAGVGYAGYAQATSGLSLPVTPEFNSLSQLLGGQSTLRVWWRGTRDWRVDSVDLTGETDVHQDSYGQWTWDYESNTATRTPFLRDVRVAWDSKSNTVTRTPFLRPDDVRLPRADDLAPPSLARRLLSQAGSAEVSRLPDARIAERDTAGLRLRPAQPGSTISRVDIWALPSSGLALRVNVYAAASTRPVVTTSMLDVSTHMPAASAVEFVPPPGAKVRQTVYPDVVAAIDQFAQADPPAVLAGLTRAPGPPVGRGSVGGSVGVYGAGITLLVVLPLPPPLADSLAHQLSNTAAVIDSGDAATLTVGPLNLRLTARADNGTRWLLAGTVTTATLARAAGQLPAINGFDR